MNKPLLAATLLALTLPALQGCVPAVATGVGAGALMIVDRRNAETYLADEAIEIRSFNRINEKFGDKVHINVTSYNLKVLLTGEVPDEGIKAELEKAVAGIANVKGVVNEAQVGAVSGFQARSNDTYITSKVKARFIDANKFQANHVKVVTEAGTVFLLGLVTRKEADEAAEIARTTAGVKKVVRVFEYVEIREAQRLDNRPAEEAKPKPAEPK
ncbi:MAG: BON domain-containing protein [Rhodocyclaceae bacterium]|nr:BON domain-containing protein [Rhodocyclaceae bacterium]